MQYKGWVYDLNAASCWQAASYLDKWYAGKLEVLWKLFISGYDVDGIFKKAETDLNLLLKSHNFIASSCDKNKCQAFLNELLQTEFDNVV